MIKNKLQNITAKIIFYVGLLFAIMPFATAMETINKDEWQFNGEIYLWGPSIAMETTTGSDVDIYLWGPSIAMETTTGSDVDISFKDIIDNLDFAMMGTIAARKNK